MKMMEEAVTDDDIIFFPGQSNFRQPTAYELYLLPQAGLFNCLLSITQHSCSTVDTMDDTGRPGLCDPQGDISWTAAQIENIAPYDTRRKSGLEQLNKMAVRFGKIRFGIGPGLGLVFH